MPENAYDRAIRLLSGREHGAHELLNKLIQKGYTEQDAYDALQRCQALGLQDDLRFAENLCRSRLNRGYGPLRIRQELQTKHIALEQIEQVLEQYQSHWLQQAQHAWEKKFKPPRDTSYAGQQKQKQFLHYRGFSHDTIAKVFDE